MLVEPPVAAAVSGEKRAALGVQVRDLVIVEGDGQQRRVDLEGTGERVPHHRNATPNMRHAKAVPTSRGMAEGYNAPS